MRLLVCTTEYFPKGAGIANVVYNVVEQLKKMNVECSVCSPTGPDIKLGNRNLIQETGIGGLLYFWYQVSRYFKDNDFDVVWLHNPFFITKNPFRDCLVTMHSTYFGSSTRSIGNLPIHLYKLIVAKIERYCLTGMHHTTHFTGVSLPVCEELEKIGIGRDRIAYIPNGVNALQFRPLKDKNQLREKFGIQRENVILLSIGRFTPAKQPFTLIEVFSHLEKELEKVTLCIVGKGELFEATRNLAKKRGVRNMLLLGYVDHNQDLPTLYACADYYIITSKYEGLPLTLLEAMASGLPCIVSDIPNLRIVKDANCGIIINFENIDNAAHRICQYLMKDHQDHSQNARSYAVKNHDWHIISNQYLKEFLEISHDR